MRREGGKERGRGLRGGKEEERGVERGGKEEGREGGKYWEQ